MTRVTRCQKQCFATFSAWQWFLHECVDFVTKPKCCLQLQSCWTKNFANFKPLIFWCSCFYIIFQIMLPIKFRVIHVHFLEKEKVHTSLVVPCHSPRFGICFLQRSSAFVVEDLLRARHTSTSFAAEEGCLALIFV